jgi:hypothetical protein
MSIDAVIYDVRNVPDGYELVLHPRRTAHGRPSIPGQPTLTIVDPTWEPPLDVAIWGDASVVTIETRPKREYRRDGYTRLREAFSDEVAR